jgi:hypothetical protein
MYATKAKSILAEAAAAPAPTAPVEQAASAPAA